MIEIEAIDLFVESDPTSEDEQSMISLRVPADREFARQIKELGAKWDDSAKEWRIVGDEGTVKQISALCKAVFPELPRRRNRLVAAQIVTEAVEQNQQDEIELVARVNFVVNRTIKTYRRGQNLKWAKEFREVVALPAAAATEQAEADYVNRLRPEIRELERAATEAFEALLLNRKDAVTATLREAGLEQG